ncbi:MAG: hypothetical protein RIC11_06675 [Botrimarina sp.]
MTPHNRDLDARRNPDNWPVDRSALRSEGERRRDHGMAAAACPKALRVRAGQVALLDALLRSPDGTATIDDATAPDDLRAAFTDGGQWRGTVPRALAAMGLIDKVAIGSSQRPSRHAGTRGVWRLVDRTKGIIARCRFSAAVNLALRETPPAGTDGASDGSNPNQEDSNRG